MPVLILLLVVLALLILIILLRTFRFTPQPAEETPLDPVSFDEHAAEQSLAALVKCKTVSYSDHSLEDDGEFEKLIGLLPTLYPLVFQHCTFQRLPDRALLFHWKGRDSSGDPAVLMAHYDVVPVEEENWEKPPFSAEIEDGVMWGRGTLDTKVTFNGILFAANTLLSQGFTPAQDVYFAFSGGEEVNGMGAVRIVEWFQQHNITPSMVVDEGGAVVQDVFPGVKEPCALIGIAEKGMLNLEYKISSSGGHASAPAPHTPIGRLAAACTKVEGHPFPFHITKPVQEMFNRLGRHSTFVYRMLFANLWCFGPVLDLVCKQSGGELNALVRTTVAFTQMAGSKAPNVIPPSASLVANMRLNPEDSVASAVEYIRQTVGDEDITLTVMDHMEPSPISRTDCDGWHKVANAVAATWPGSLISPYLMVQCSDSRHYRDLSDKVYRFSAMDLTSEERKTIHGNNERIRLECLHRSVAFFLHLLQQC